MTSQHGIASQKCFAIGPANAAIHCILAHRFARSRAGRGPRTASLLSVPCKPTAGLTPVSCSFNSSQAPVPVLQGRAAVGVAQPAVPRRRRVAAPAQPLAPQKAAAAAAAAVGRRSRCASGWNTATFVVNVTLGRGECLADRLCTCHLLLAMMQHMQQPSGASSVEAGVLVFAADRAGRSSGRRHQEAADSGEDSDANERRKFWVGSDCVQRVSPAAALAAASAAAVVTVCDSAPHAVTADAGAV